MDFAQALIDSRMRRRTLVRPSQTLDKFALDKAYQIAAKIDKTLLDRGWRHAGRKLGFTNSATWDEFDLATPIWAYIYNRTVVDAESGECDVKVSDLVAPRIEPEVVLGLNDNIRDATNDIDALARAVDWVAPGFEIVDCHFPAWQFNAADIVADFGAHARLVVGPRVPIGAEDRKNLSSDLAAVSVELKEGSKPVDSGFGYNALGGPLSALKFLVEALDRQTWATRLDAGEIVTTGTLTRIPFVHPGEHWSAAFSGAGLGALTIKLI